MTLLAHPIAADVLGERLPQGYGGRFYGAYPALVSDIKDPDGIGRVKVSLPWSPDGSNDGYEVPVNAVSETEKKRPTGEKPQL